MLIKQTEREDCPSWLKLRKQLWPHITEIEHQQQMCEILSQTTSWIAFIAVADDKAIGFAEASLRYDYVAGCSNKPVAYLEGIYVLPDKRKQGLAKQLCSKVEAWGKNNGCEELASDVELANLVSQQVHQALKFQEAERVVCYYKKIG